MGFIPLGLPLDPIPLGSEGRGLEDLRDYYVQVLEDWNGRVPLLEKEEKVLLLQHCALRMVFSQVMPHRAYVVRVGLTVEPAYPFSSVPAYSFEMAFSFRSPYAYGRIQGILPVVPGLMIGVDFVEIVPQTSSPDPPIARLSGP
jgi:hypothetical protein